MHPFRYSDEHIGENELMFALPSIIIGIATLTFPSHVAKVTSFSDGWISIVIAGILFTLFSLLGIKVATSFPNKSFFEYTSFLVTKPIAIIIMFGIILSFLSILSLVIGNVAFVTQRYLFDQTPIEVIGLIFLLVVVYAVSGSRAGVFRLNILFLPLILFAFMIVIIFNFKWYEYHNLFPLFQTNIKGYLQGIHQSFEAFGGFSIVLFYTYLLYKPKHLNKKVMIGIGIPTVLYVAIFLMCIAIFGNIVTGNLLFPTIEAAKRVDIPGAIFERVDAFVFTIWVMAFFNTAAIILDVLVLLLCSIFQKVDKRMMIFILSPIIFYIALFPQQINFTFTLGSIVNQFNIYYICFIILLLYIMVKIRGVPQHGK